MARFRFGKNIVTQLEESGFRRMSINESDTYSLEEALDAIKADTTKQRNNGRKISEPDVFELEFYIAPNYVVGNNKEGYSLYCRAREDR